MHSTTRRTRSIRAAAAIAALLGVTACSQQSTEPDEEVWPPTEIPAASEPYCDPTQIQYDHIIVDFQPAITPSQADSFAAAYNLSLIEPVRYGNSYHYLLNDTTAITSHELAVQVRNESPKAILWAEPTMPYVEQYDSGTVSYRSLTVDILMLWIIPEAADSLSAALATRFSLIPIPEERWPIFIQIADSLWRLPGLDGIPAFFEIDRNLYGYNWYTANCLASLIHPIVGEEYLPDRNPIRVAGPIDRFIRAWDSR